MPLSRLTPMLFGLALCLPASAATPAADTDLGWLAGAWCGGEAGEAIEETWLAPVAGELVGLSRTARDGKPRGYEFMRIAPANGVPTFFAQPGGKPPTAFPATEAGERRIRFANEHHDFPQWVEYWREGERLHARIGGPGGDDGKEMRIAFRYERCATPSR